MELPPLSRIPGAQRGTSVYHMNNGYFFTRVRLRGDTYYFRCTKWRSGCQVTASLRSGSFVSSLLHNHDPDPHHIEFQLERQVLLAEASNLEHATLGDVFTNTRLLFEDRLTPHSLQPAMSRMRLNALPIEPTTLQELNAVLRDERFRCISATSEFDDTVYHGSTVAQDNCFVILLLTQECKKFMRMSVTLFGLTAPFTMQGALHEYVVHVIYTMWDNTIVILAWFFLERISEQGFIGAFSYLKHVLEWTHFKTIVCQHGSLEAAAYKSVFPSVTVTFCLQGFVQNVGNFMLSEIPNPDSHLIDLACLLCALPILPSDFLHFGLTAIRGKVMSYQGVQEHANRLLGYVESTWTGVLSDFSASGDHYRTSNIKETVERKVNKILDKHKNNIYNLIGGIARTAEQTKRDIQDIKCAKKVRQRISVVSLSNLKEITMLTQALIHPFSSPITASLNLLNAAALRIRHLLSQS